MLHLFLRLALTILLILQYLEQILLGNEGLFLQVITVLIFGLAEADGYLVVALTV